MKLLLLILAVHSINAADGSKLFLLLLDGFRWDYFSLDGLQLRGFPRLFREGVKAEYMIPSFPTNSYPNYYTLMTGNAPVACNPGLTGSGTAGITAGLSAAFYLRINVG